MGLTGAGGALISIPLFMAFLNAPLKEATTLSLVVVLIGAALNLATSDAKPDHRTSFVLMVTSMIGSYLSLPLKENMPDLIVAMALIFIALYSVWSVWSKKSSSIEKNKSGILWTRAIITGALLGVLTTLTGLGGGVLLVPIFIKFFNKDYPAALSTSLLSILLVSAISLYLQRGMVTQSLNIIDGLALFIGVLIGALLLRWTSKRVELNRLNTFRKISFSVVAAYSIGSFALNALR